MVYKFFDKMYSGSAVKSEIMPNEQFVEKLHQIVIRKSEKRKAQPSFKDNIWGADLADMQLISKLNKNLTCYW